jgi:WD40 repeat protein
MASSFFENPETVLASWPLPESGGTRQLPDQAGGIMSLEFAPDGRALAAGSMVWLSKSARPTHRFPLPPKSAGVFDLTYSPDGRSLATAYMPDRGKDTDRVATVWNLESGAELFTLPCRPLSGFRCLAYSPDGKRLAVALHDSVVICDAATGAEVTRHATLSAPYCIAFSPNGRWLAAGCGGPHPPNREIRGEVMLWDAATGQPGPVLPEHGLLVWRLAFSPDSRLLVTTCDDRTARVWEVGSGATVRTLSGHTRKLYDVAFSPDGRRLATVGGDGTVKLWDTDSWREVLTIAADPISVNAVAFSPDGRVLATFSWASKAVRLWDATQLGEEPEWATTAE